MIHQTITFEPEDRQRLIRRRRTAHQHRTALAELQARARRIMAGDYDPRPISPRQRRLYGRHVPQHVALRSEISYHRTFTLGQKLKLALYRGAERETFIERRTEIRIAHYATGLRRRRAARTHRMV